MNQQQQLTNRIETTHNRILSGKLKESKTVPMLEIMLKICRDYVSKGQITNAICAVDTVNELVLDLEKAN